MKFAKILLVVVLLSLGWSTICNVTELPFWLRTLGALFIGWHGRQISELLGIVKRE